MIGVLSSNRSDQEKHKTKGEKIKIAIISLLHLQDDIPADLADEVIESIQVRGIFIASEAIKAVLADQIK